MLELRSAAGAFAELEDWLRDRGFFRPGGEELRADLFLGYGLSETASARLDTAAARALSAAPAPGLRRPGRAVRWRV